jgi:hypothetical protein
MSIGRSFIYNRNRIGPRTEPWGTPCLTSFTTDVLRVSKISSLVPRNMVRSTAYLRAVRCSTRNVRKQAAGTNLVHPWTRPIATGKTYSHQLFGSTHHLSTGTINRFCVQPRYWKAECFRLLSSCYRHVLTPTVSSIAGSIKDSPIVCCVPACAIRK